MSKILMVLTSANHMEGRESPTGYWLEEVAAPYYVFTRQDCEVDMATLTGAGAPCDPESLKDEHLTKEGITFRKDAIAQQKISHPLQLTETMAESYDAVFFPGGHGTMIDFPSNEVIQRLVETFDAQEKPIASLCHGPACLVDAKNKQGEPLIKGKHFTCFSNEEEEAIELSEVVPFLLQTRLTQQGGRFECNSPFEPYVVTDGHIITGQNPASSALAAKAVLTLLAR